MNEFKIAQIIEIAGKKATVLGWVRYDEEGVEYFVWINDVKFWLEPDEEKWKLWKEVNGEGNPVVGVVRNSDVADLVESTHGNFYVSSQGVATASESNGDTWRIKAGKKVELWRGKNTADKDWPLFIVERDEDGRIALWVGQYVTVSER